MDNGSSRVNRLLPYLAAGALIIWSWRRLDFFTFRQPVVAAESGNVELPNALASVDHPFHAARFGELLEALGQGHVPRWVAEHHGGYPSEFYPFGGAVLDLLIWLATFGQMSIPMVHTWAVAVAFSLPAVAFLWICSSADLTPWAGVIALAAHLCVRGWWWSGGSRELVEWGLITNVLASYLMFLALAAVVHLERTGNLRWAPLPAVLIAWGIWTNPRSLIAVGAVMLALVFLRTVQRRARGGVAGPAATLLIALLLAAPLLISLVRFDDLYYFVHYHGYTGLRDWLDSSVQAVSTPIFVLALVGLGVALRPRSTDAELIVAYTFVAYCAVTLYLVKIDWPQSLTEQLETTRLMPFQRLMMIALAAIAAGRLLEWLMPRLVTVAGAAVAGAIVILYVVSPPGWIPESDRGLLREGTMATPGIADLRTSVEIADYAAESSTALLILGHTDFWHDHLWATLWSDRRFFYDDWLWYWQREHVGEYDPEIEHSYPLDSSAIDEEFLRTHGIGAVIVTAQAKPAAASAPFLSNIRQGIYDVYLVNEPGTLASMNGTPVAASEQEDRIEVSGLEDGGVLTIRQNWFPRWRASAGGVPLEVTHRTDGYMDIEVPAGTSTVKLTYGVDMIDWVARGCVVLGLILSVAVLAGVRPIAQSEPQ
jgi:hypothetical protein